jgi:hypothetical protein
MPHFLARKTLTYHYLFEADSEEDARNEAEDLPDFDWEQSDGPLIEVEPVSGEPTQNDLSGSFRAIVK